MPYFLEYDKKAGKAEVLGSDLGKKVVKNYNKLATTLLTFEELWYDGWRKVRRYAILLFVPLLRKKESDAPTPCYEINFSKNASQLLSDTEVFKQFKKPLPSFATRVWEQKLDCACCTNL